MDELLMQKPPGMRKKTAAKVEAYVSHLYMHGVLTAEQIWMLTGKRETVTEVNRILRKSTYVRGKNHSMKVYKDGEWRMMNRFKVWQLTPDGERVAERDIYNGSDKWAYSSGKIHRDVTVRRHERIVRVAQFYVEMAQSPKGVDFSFWDVAHMLNEFGIREDFEAEKPISVTSLWRHRPSLAGIIGVGEERIVGLSLYDSDTLNGLGQYLNRAFPEEFNRLTSYDISVGGVLLLTESLYTRYLPVLSKFERRHHSLMILPYEYSIDHAEAIAWLLRGNRHEALRPLVEKYERDGWHVEKTENIPGLTREPYTYCAMRNGVVEFFDSTFGTELMQLYSLFDHERATATSSAPGARVLYVTSEKEEAGIKAYLTKRHLGKFGTHTEFRLLEL